MRYDKKELGSLDFTLIERSLTGNRSYDKEKNVKITFNSTTTDDSFEISLFAEKKDSDITFRIETRVALEQHSELNLGHQYPHIQIDNFASDEELLKTGKLHIALIAHTRDELEKCCNGFVYTIGHILELITKLFELEGDLKDFFFNIDAYDKLKVYQETLHELIHRSFKENKLVYENKKIELVHYKGKKSEETLDTGDIFKVLRILLLLKLLNPIMLKPILQLVKEDPQIASKCPELNLGECETKLLSKDAEELKHYNKAEFINDFR
jgi:hypothetical protein